MCVVLSRQYAIIRKSKNRLLERKKKLVDRSFLPRLFYDLSRTNGSEMLNAVRFLWLQHDHFNATLFVTNNNLIDKWRKYLTKGLSTLLVLFQHFRFLSPQRPNIQGVYIYWGGFLLFQFDCCKSKK